VNDLQRNTAKAIVNIFETGRPGGDYGAVTLLKNDPGHLTYGRSQTTLASGNLFLLIKAYCERTDANAEIKQALQPFLPALAKPDLTLDTNLALRDALKDAGADEAMMKEQDRFFDAHYLDPALRTAASLGIQTALGQTVVYDSTVHGSFKKVAARVGTNVGAGGDDEKSWVAKYVATRARWLREHTNPLLRKTVYRMEAFDKLIQGGAWELPLKLTVRDVIISEDTFNQFSDVVRAVAADPDDPPAPRVLHLTTPYQRGDDVKLAQEALQTNGFANARDGVFGPFTAALVRRFQQSRGLRDDGVLGPNTRLALGI